MIKLYKNIFSEEDHLRIKEFVNRPLWEFGQVSSANSDDLYPFFKMNLKNEYFFTNYIFEKIESITESKFKILDLYANGNLFGTPGSPHIDSICDEDYTFLMYANEEWDITAGGIVVAVHNPGSCRERKIPAV